MEINQIRYFLAVCAERNFSRAAVRCGVAQPTVTIGIKALERELRGHLFYRNYHRVALTQLGEAMLPHLTRAIQAIDRARAVAALNAEQLTGRDEVIHRGNCSTSFSEA
jgi:LysR family hydrogen peroxide-inducible transcriptional activator